MRSGVTLIELMVAITIVAVVTGVGLAALGRPRHGDPRTTERALDSTRAQVIRSGTAHTSRDSSGLVRLLPDGRVVRLTEWHR